MSKGGRILVFLVISNSLYSFQKSTPSWLPSSPKGEIVSIMMQVLSLMTTHSQVNSVLVKGNSQYNMYIKRLQGNGIEEHEDGTNIY